MITEVINKIIITEEAVFDYEESLGLKRLDKSALKSETEEYIDYMNRNGRLLYENYFRCKYLDNESGRMLMLFLCRADKMNIMQNWRLAGVCFAEDWGEDAEEDGKIRAWLESGITDSGDGDWVIEQAIRAEAHKILCGWPVRGAISGLSTEVKSAIEHGNDQGTAEAVSLLQNAIGKRAWREHFERTIVVSRKGDKRVKRGGL